ncbi:MAG TPA: enoyl-CoA hydratase [Acidimicrobiales bacterium]|jgi:enoyl-CoA hydratase
MTTAVVRLAQDVVRVEAADRVAIVTLNRPEARNALSPALVEALWQAMVGLGERDDIGAVVLTGAHPAFCSGADLKVLREATGRAWLRRLVDERRGLLLPDIGLPVVAAVNGPAVTGGLELALQCDFIVASDRARFAETHARIGIMSAGSIASLLPEAIGIRRARQLSFTGEFIDSRTALAWGLVNDVVPHDSLVPRAVDIAAQMALNDRKAVAFMRTTYQLTTHDTDVKRRDLEVGRFAEWLRSSEVPSVHGR